jgi:AcrR family transcriptional regulator
MDCALELFSAYGYDGLGVQNVCEAAAVISRPAPDAA